jgi:hypothetical protein
MTPAGSGAGERHLCDYGFVAGKGSRSDDERQHCRKGCTTRIGVPPSCNVSKRGIAMSIAGPNVALHTRC